MVGRSERLGEGQNGRLEVWWGGVEWKAKGRGRTEGLRCVGAEWKARRKQN